MPCGLMHARGRVRAARQVCFAAGDPARACALPPPRWQYDLCDVFIELMKPVMAADPEVRFTALGRIACLCH